MMVDARGLIRDMRPMPLPPLDSPKWNGQLRAFAWGFADVVVGEIVMITGKWWLG